MIIFHNDHKDKPLSYEVRYVESGDLSSSFHKRYPHVDACVNGHSLEDVSGYGATKEEAIENYRIALSYLIEEFKAVEKLYLQTTFVENNIVEADCFGKPLEENR